MTHLGSLQPQPASRRPDASRVENDSAANHQRQSTIRALKQLT